MAMASGLEDVMAGVLVLVPLLVSCCPAIVGALLLTLVLE